MQPVPHIGLLAGEASGDMLGAGLIRALRDFYPDLVCSGVGGQAMQAEGFNSLYPMERLSVMGIIDPLKRLPELLRIRNGVRQYFLKHRPDVFIGIDSPDFNLGLEVSLREAGIPVVHYVSPSVWAWRQNRVKKIAKACDLVLTLFPFEADFYRKHQVRAEFIGHPLADVIPLDNDRQHAKGCLGLDPSVPCLAILPGSRQGELEQMAPLFLDVASRVAARMPALTVISASANKARHEELLAFCRKQAPELQVKVFLKEARKVMTAADAVLVTSGTATLETLLCGSPMVIAYRMSALIFPLIRALVRTPFIGLPNLLAGEKIVPEFVQQEATPVALSEAILNFMHAPACTRELQDRFRRIHETLRCNADRKAAMAVMTLLAQGAMS